MRSTRLFGLLGGFLIALLATGWVRIGHMMVSHGPEPVACGYSCMGHDAEPTSNPVDAPLRPAAPTPTDCATCDLLAVLTTDGLPALAEPFFPASPAIVVESASDRIEALENVGLVLARGPPARS